MLEDLNRPHTWGGSQRQYKFFTAPQPPPPPPPPLPVHQPAPALPYLPPAPPQPPRIIQQTVSINLKKHPNPPDLSLCSLLSVFNPLFLLALLSRMQ